MRLDHITPSGLRHVPVNRTRTLVTRLPMVLREVLFAKSKSRLPWRTLQKGFQPLKQAPLRCFNPFPGGHSAVVPPDPIPNSEVKRSRADGSVHLHARVGHRQGLYPQTPSPISVGVFAFPVRLSFQVAGIHGG